MNQKSESLRIAEMELNLMETRFDKPYDKDFGKRSFEEREDMQTEYNKINSQVDFFHPWYCVSLHVYNATVDFAIKDKNQLFALLHVLNHKVNGVPRDKTPGDCLRPLKWLRFKMRISYEAWR
jgi:hypothetical protein